MLNRNLNFKILLRFLLLFLIALFIFIYSESYERYVKIEDFTHQTTLKNEEGFYYDITQEYPKIELMGFDIILKDLFQKIKYKEICFRDDGSKIIGDAFKGSSLMVSVTYSNETRLVSHNVGWEMISPSKEECFNIVDKSRIIWNWEFSSDSPITKGFLEVKDFESFIVSPNVSTYLKVNNAYYLFVGLLSLFYSGVFLWALTRIWKYLKEGFK